jgi:DNA-binding NarL/FixJ family response regulator
VLSPLTVRNHLTSIPAKLGVTDRQAAAEAARRAGMTGGVPEVRL